MRDDLHSLVQKFIANTFSIAIVRRMGPKGTLHSIRNFLKAIDLAAIGKKEPSRYPEILDDLTEKLLRALPQGTRHWGVARKCLNLFFRDALYNFYLRERYQLAKFERYLEIPLDSYVGRQLKQEIEGADLPRWHTVKGLKREQSRYFQAVAAKVAKRKGVSRIHLDLEYWRGDVNRAIHPTSRSRSSPR